jgi:hypothetical protein
VTYSTAHSKCISRGTAIDVTALILRSLATRFACRKHRAFRISSLALLFFVGVGSLHAAALFKTAKTYVSGGGDTTSVAVADLNGDGFPDIVLGNAASAEGPGSVTVLIGKGDGTFGAPQTVGPSDYIRFVAVGDVNGDGKPDLIELTNNLVGVMLGNGDGTFQAIQRYNPGVFPFSVAVADLNKDGKMDLIVGGADGGYGGTGAVSVLLGNGDGSFQPAQIYASGGGCCGSYGGTGPSVAVADVNGDGNLDVVASNAGPLGVSEGSVGVLLGNGDGTFQPVQSYDSGGQDSDSIAVADVNGDGKLDLLVASGYGEGNAGVLLGNGDGTFQPVHTYDSGGHNPTSIAVADVNLDGKADLVMGGNIAGTSRGVVSVLLGNGDGSFQAAQIYLTGGQDVTSLALADVNGDGKLDVLVANWRSKIIRLDGNVAVLLGTALFHSVTSLTSSLNPSNHGQAVTLTATVASPGPILPTGKVKFMNDAKSIGSATLSGGVATLTTKKLPVGTLSIIATYQGDSQSAKSTSSVLIQVVNPVPRGQ